MDEHTPIQSIRAEIIEQALLQHTRQYLAGNLKQPQTLQHIPDARAEFGISDYTAYHWEAAHYHTVTSEYCYILSGTTKYVDFRIPLADGIYTEMTLFWSRGGWHAFPWTYRDYQSERVRIFLTRVRQAYKKARRNTLAAASPDGV